MVNPKPSYLFPLPASALREYFDNFGGFNEAELELIEGSNLTLGDPTDPAHHLLSFREVPELSDEERQQHPEYDHMARAYRAGACIGMAIVRGRISNLKDEDGVVLPELRVEPGRTYLDHETTQSIEPGQSRTIARRLTDMRVEDYTSYFSDESAMTLMSQMKNRWLGRLGFMTPEDVETKNDAYVTLGFLDALALAAVIHDQGRASLK
jgi:hypothetical protein